MRINIIPITIYDNIYYLAQYKKHWWSRWKYVKNTVTNYPHLFKSCISAQLMAEIGKDFNPKIFID